MTIPTTQTSAHPRRLLRSVGAVLLGFVTVVAPRNPMRHALALGIVGLVVSLAGAIGTITMADLGPSWYPIALVLTALPCAWLGGALHRGKPDGRS